MLWRNAIGPPLVQLFPGACGVRMPDEPFGADFFPHNARTDPTPAGGAAAVAAAATAGVADEVKGSEERRDEEREEFTLFLSTAAAAAVAAAAVVAGVAVVAAETVVVPTGAPPPLLENLRRWGPFEERVDSRTLRDGCLPVVCEETAAGAVEPPTPVPAADRVSVNGAALDSAATGTPAWAERSIP